jgi:hypothetical protein
MHHLRNKYLYLLVVSSMVVVLLSLTLHLNLIALHMSHRVMIQVVAVVIHVLIVDLPVEDLMTNGFRGLKQDLDGGREVGVAIMDDKENFVFHFASPVGECADEEALIKRLRELSVQIVDGKVVLQYRLTKEAFYTMMGLGLKVTSALMEEEYEAAKRDS